MDGTQEPMKRLLLLAACAVSSGLAAERDYLPLPTDWGRDILGGRPTVVRAECALVRLTETGWYGFVLDTQRMSIPHFGALPPERDVRAWEKLPSADRVSGGGGRQKLYLPGRGRMVV